MDHTFLLEAGRWKIQGNWLERNGMPINLQGKLIIVWNQNNWFTMVTKLIFEDDYHLSEIAAQYRGRLDGRERVYTFVLQHSLLGQVEGEGWIGPDSIVQRYWVLNDRQRRSGFETFYRLDDHTYHLSSGILAGYYLSNTMEVTLERL